MLGKGGKLGCIALGLGKWSELRKDFSLYLVIEDLTHKTGNFKQFSIFCNMLESALTQVGARVGGGFCPLGPREGRCPSDVCKTFYFSFIEEIGLSFLLSQMYMAYSHCNCDDSDSHGDNSSHREM